MPRGRILIFAGICLALAAGLAITTMVISKGREPTSGAALAVSSTGQPLIGGPFQLVNQDSQIVDQSLLDGKWSLVFFGFTWCPDYCPTTLTGLQATKAQLGPRGEDLQILFVSVDPERDTPAVLKTYLSSDGFPDGVVGLTGSAEQVAEAARVYRALYQKVGEGDAYTMNHSLTVYLMGPDGKFRQALAHDLGPERSAEVIERAMAKG